MAEIRVKTSTFASGELSPSVCVATGGLARNQYRVVASYTPRWTLALIPLAIVPYLAAATMLRRTQAGALSFSEPAAKRLQTQRLISLALFGGGALLALTAMLTSSGALAVAGITTLAVGVASAAWTFSTTVGARLSEDGEHVTLKRVNPRWVESLDHKGGSCVGCDNSGGCKVVDVDAGVGELQSSDGDSGLVSRPS